METSRRKLLWSLPPTTVLGGCIEGSVVPPGSFVARNVELVETDRVPAHDWIEDVSATLGDEQVRASSTASLELSFTYGGDEGRHLEFPFFTHGAFQPVESEGESGLLLFGSQDLERARHCWSLASGGRLASTGEMPGYRFEPGERFSTTAYVWDDHRSDECFPTGEHRFETTLDLDGDRVRWGFRIRVSDPE